MINVYPVQDEFGRPVVYCGREIGCEPRMRHIHTPQGESETGSPEFRAAWRRVGETSWLVGHILVDRMDEVVPLAKECIDFALAVEHQEFIMGRPMKTSELSEFAASLTGLQEKWEKERDPQGGAGHAASAR